MKLRGAWGIAAKFMGVATLLCCVLLLTFPGGLGKHIYSGKAGSIAAGDHAAKPGNAMENRRWAEAYGKLPMSFEENQGQTAREVRYVSHGRGYELFLTPQEAVIALRFGTHLDFSPLHRSAYLRALRKQRRAAQTTAIRMHLEGANPEPQISGEERLPTHVNYFTGSDPKNWHTDVPAYARVKYSGIYPGVDLVFYGNQRRLEYDFVVAPGADPKAIQLRIDGARKMGINSRGDVVLSVAEGEVELQKPLIYQQLNGEKREIAGKYVLAGDHRVTFAVASYDRSEPLILDPILNYSTYLGGSGREGGFPMAIAVDNAGDAFVAGLTASIDFPAGTNAGIGTNPNPNAGASFVAELNPAGTQLLYSTYLAGNTTNVGDGATGVAVDSTGKVYVTGVTFAAGFPSMNPLPYSANTISGTCFVTKLDPTQSGNGSLVFSTYLGGTGGEIGNAIAVDANGNAYVAGQTLSTDFPVTNTPANTAYQTTFDPANVNNAFGSAFLSKINTTNSTLVYSTYLSGNAANAANPDQVAPGYADQAFGVAVDTSNNAYVVGVTTSNNSTDFPSSTNANQMAPPVANVLASAFVSKINTAGSGPTSLVYSTYIAGSTEEQGLAIALGPNNVAYVTGLTNSSDFPTTTGAFNTSVATGGQAYVSVVDTTKTGVGNSLTYSTFLGGSGGDTGFGIRVDAAGNAYVTGTTNSPDFPGTNTGTKLGGFQTTRSNPAGNAFIAKLFPGSKGTADLLYSTYFGGSGDGTANTNPDQGYAIAIDSANPPNAYITGDTPSPDLPVVSHLPTGGTLNGTSDAYVAKFSLIPTLTIVPPPGTTLDFGTVVIGTTSAAQTVTLTNNTPGNISFTSAAKSGTNAADYTVTTAGCSPNIVVGTPCVVSVKFTPTVLAPPSEVATLTITDGDSTSPQVYSLTGKGSNPAPPDFTLSAAPTTLTVRRGAVGAPVTITVNPANGFNSAVALTCTGAPAGSTCALSPTSITPPTTSTLTFTAHAVFLPLPNSRPAPPLNLLRIVPLLVAVMLLFLLRSTQRLRTRVAMVTVILCCVTMAACSGASGPAKGNYPLTITGTSGALSHNTTVTVTVN
jgi:hypothetical protein